MKLSSWRKESQRELSNIINSYNISINKGVNDLVQEVCDLKSELSTVKVEKNYLLETVNNLSSENQKLRAVLPLHNLSTPEESYYQDKGKREIKIADTENLCAKRPTPTMNSKKQVKIEPFGEIGHDMVDETNEYDLKPSIFNELENSGVNGIEDGEGKPHMILSTSVENKKKKMKRQRDSPNHVCPECKFPFSTRESLEMHLISIHSKSDHNDISPMENEHSRKRHKPTTRSSKSIRHNKKDGVEQPRKDFKKEEISGVSDKKQGYVCAECGYVASQIGNLKRHRSMTHRRLKVVSAASMDMPPH